MLTDLGLPAAARPAGAGSALRVDGHVPDLTAVAAVAGDGAAARDDATADAGITVEIDDVVDADGNAASVLGQHREVGTVANGRRQV